VKSIPKQRHIILFLFSNQLCNAPVNYQTVGVDLYSKFFGRVRFLPTSERKRRETKRAAMEQTTTTKSLFKTEPAAAKGKCVCVRERVNPEEKYKGGNLTPSTTLAAVHNNKLRH